MRSSEARNMERGITLVALIITIIVLIILAAVTIFAFKDSKLIEVAINGTINYANAQTMEESIMIELSDRLDEELEKLERAQGGKRETEEEIPGKLTVETAKNIINGSNLKEYLGEEVEYAPEAGGTWRVFYYDETGEFGTAKTLYLKRDYDSNATDTGYQKSYSQTQETLNIMKRMNPLWANSANSTDTLNINERTTEYFYDQTKWASYKTEEADLVIASPSVEMYMKSYNISKGSNNALVCKIGNTNGYSVGANGSYSHNSGYTTASDTVDQTLANGMYSYSNRWWLASPSAQYSMDILFVNNNYMYHDANKTYGICPVVAFS